MFERWHWTLIDDVEPLDWADFCVLADTVQLLNERDIEARKQSNKPAQGNGRRTTRP